jgi:Na+-transporting methylmalonyl-CoA/oxaloacetate decarboxylase gamma subunit
MHPAFLIAMTTEELGHSHSVMDALPHLGGMLMVLATLMALWGLTVLISKMVALLPKKPDTAVAAKTPVIAPAAVTPTPQSDLTPPEIIAVIAAAVAASIGSSHRIISIKPMSTSWERAGRQSVLTSHRIR